MGALDSFFILKSLSLYQFGVYQLFLSGYATLSDFFHDVFAEVAGNDLQRFVGEDKEAAAKKLFLEYAAFRMIMGVIPWAIVMAGASLFSDRYGPDAILWARILSFLFLIDAAMNVSLLLLKLRLEFRLLALLPTVEKIIQFILLGYFFFFSHLGIREIFAAQVVSSLLILFLTAPWLARAFRPWRIIAARRGMMLPAIVRSYGKWALPRSLLTDFNGRVRPWIIKLFLSTEAGGVFGVAYTFISLVKDLLPTRTLTMLVPRKVHDKPYKDFLFVYGTKYYLLLSIILSTCAAVAVPAAVFVT